MFTSYVALKKNKEQKINKTLKIIEECMSCTNGKCYKHKREWSIYPETQIKYYKTNSISKDFKTILICRS